VRAAFILGAGLTFLGAAHAGHEFPFYPSFYPQEITVEALDARAAAQRLADGTLHAYAGGEIAATADRAKIGTVTSLGGYLVATFDPGAPALADRSARCAAARGLKDARRQGYLAPVPRHPISRRLPAPRRSRRGRAGCGRRAEKRTLAGRRQARGH
jgi:hypothetical protein